MLRPGNMDLQSTPHRADGSRGMLPQRDTISASVWIIRLSRVDASISIAPESGPPNAASTARFGQPLSHLSAVLREMRSASIPIAEIAQQQAVQQRLRRAA